MFVVVFRYFNIFLNMEGLGIYVVILSIRLTRKHEHGALSSSIYVHLFADVLTNIEDFFRP